MTLQHRSAWLWIGLAFIACVLYQALVYFYLAAADAGAFRPALVFLQGAPHAAINVFLLWVFGRTLRKGREPLITAFARSADCTLPPYLEGYTRRVTVLWCIVFAVQVIASAALLAAAPLHVWAIFVNVVSVLLVVVTFVGEYGYRVVRYRNYPHVSMWAGIRMFAERRSGAKREAAPQ